MSEIIRTDVKYGDTHQQRRYQKGKRPGHSFYHNARVALATSLLSITPTDSSEQNAAYMAHCAERLALKRKNRRARREALWTKQYEAKRENVATQKKRVESAASEVEKYKADLAAAKDDAAKAKIVGERAHVFLDHVNAEKDLGNAIQKLTEFEEFLQHAHMERLLVTVQ